MRLRRNLYHALLQVRLANAYLSLWIDALCINQANVDERKSQRQLMGQIYRSSRKVIVWLGNVKAESDLAMEVLGSTQRYTGVPIHFVEYSSQSL